MVYDCDVVIVGGRVAGSALAIALARKGHSVVVIDRSSLPSDKAFSTHFIGLKGVDRLQGLGVLEKIKATGCPAYDRFCLHTPVGIIDDSPPAFRNRTFELVGPRRYVLDRILIESAAESGVRIIDHAAVNGLIEAGGRVAGVIYEDKKNRKRLRIHSPLTVGADGADSYIARAVKARKYSQRPKLSCIFWRYYQGINFKEVQFYAADRASGVAFTTSDGSTIVTLTTGLNCMKALAADPEGEFAGRVAAACPALSHVTHDAPEASGVAGGALPNYLRVPVGPGWALVGDAAGLHDPISASGIADALRDADLLAGLLRGSTIDSANLHAALSEYARVREHKHRPYYDYWCRMLEFEYGAVAEGNPVYSTYKNDFWESLSRDAGKRKAFLGILAQSYDGDSADMTEALKMLGQLDEGAAVPDIEQAIGVG